MFEWDPRKNADNLKKHGIGFEQAQTIFDGPTLTIEDDNWYGGEIREMSIGFLDGNIITVVVVIHTARGDKIRIISARRASTGERKRFDDYLKQAHG